MSGLEKIYCSVPTQKSFLPSFMFPNSTVFFHTTLNSPTQLSAPCRATQEKCRSTSLKKFTRKCSKLARDAAQRLQKYPPFSAKVRRANSHCALPRRFVPPFQCSLQIPLLPISCSIRTDCYRGAAQELFRPRHASYQNHSSRFLTGGAGMGRDFLSTLKGVSMPDFQ